MWGLGNSTFVQTSLWKLSTTKIRMLWLALCVLAWAGFSHIIVHFGVLTFKNSKQRHHRHCSTMFISAINCIYPCVFCSWCRKKKINWWAVLFPINKCTRKGKKMKKKTGEKKEMTNNSITAMMETTNRLFNLFLCCRLTSQHTQRINVMSTQCTQNQQSPTFWKNLTTALIGRRHKVSCSSVNIWSQLKHSVVKCVCVWGCVSRVDGSQRSDPLMRGAA